MSIKAKVNKNDVKLFHLSVKNVLEFSLQFDKGIQCLDEFINQINKQISILENEKVKIEYTQIILNTKTNQIKQDIQSAEIKIEELNTEKDALEAELENTEETTVIYEDDKHDEEYNEKVIPNPHYVYLKGQIDLLDIAIVSKQVELDQLFSKSKRATDLSDNIDSHLKKINNSIDQLNLSIFNIRKFRLSLFEQQNKNKSINDSAIESLTTIYTIIDKYNTVKMKYQSLSPSFTIDSFSYVYNRESIQRNSYVEDNINIEISNINQTDIKTDINVNDFDESDKRNSFKGETFNSDNVELEEARKEYEIKHGIEYDEDHHISLFDGKAFGGKYNDYSFRLSYTLQDNDYIVGKYTGKRGESKFIPSNRNAKGIKVIEILANYGLDGVEYHNCEPDFEVCSEAVVTIENMTENRYNYSDDQDNILLGNFSQADEELAKLWSKENKDGKDKWSPRDIHNYRDSHNLTWHEKSDTKTMVLVRSEINAYFKHSGGVSECRVRDNKNIDFEGEFDE